MTFNEISNFLDKMKMLEAMDTVVEEVEPELYVHPLVLAMRELQAEGIVESYHTDSLVLTKITEDKEIDEEIAYHGTTDDIAEFHPLSHFGTEKAAKDRMTYKKIKDGKIYKVDLDIKNPLTIQDFPGIHYDRLYAFELRDKKLISQKEMEAITTIDDKAELRKALLTKLKELGIDGFVYKNEYEDKGNLSYVIVDPGQVKVLSVEPAAEELTEASDNKVAYHVTPTQNLRSVMKNGLVPNIGDRSSKIAGEQNGIYLFPSVEAAEDAVMNWLGDEFDKDEPLTLLKVNIDGLEKYISQGADYELIVNTAIEPNRIHKLDTQLEEASPNTLEGSFTPDLVESKTWLCEKLAKGLKGKNAGTIYVLGSWYGNMGIFLQKAGVKFDKLVLVEPDEEALMRSKKLLEPLNDEGKLILIHQNAEDIVYDKPGVIINTSCNETGPVFLTKVPKGMLCALQARNNFDDGLISTDDLQEFDELFPLEKTYYTGEKELIDTEIDYTRFMKIGRAGNALSETASTGQGGGSAGSSGGQMVGGPTTYEQEYDMFKSKGPRRITAMTNEALDSSYPYEKEEEDKYKFTTDAGIFYKVHFQGEDLVQVAFSAILPGEEDTFRPDKTISTGTGDSIKVFGTVIKIIQEYMDTHKPKTLYFTSDNEPNRIKLYNTLMSRVEKRLPDYYADKPIDLRYGKAYMIKRKDTTVTNEDNITLKKLYGDNKPHRDDSIWDYGTMIWDDEYPVKTINPNKLERYLLSQYRIEYVEELLDVMGEEQQEIVDTYVNDPALSDNIIVLANGYIVDGNHRALAAVLANKPIKYIDIGDIDEPS